VLLPGSPPPFLILRRHFLGKCRKRQVEAFLGYDPLNDEENEDEEKDILHETERQGPGESSRRLLSAGRLMQQMAQEN
jgi:hypothetical protein